MTRTFASATTLEEALDALGSGARPVAGGTDLYPNMKRRQQTPETLISLRNVGEPTGFSRFVAPLVSIAMGRQMRQDLRLLKRLVESS